MTRIKLTDEDIESVWTSQAECNDFEEPYCLIVRVKNSKSREDSKEAEQLKKQILEDYDKSGYWDYLTEQKYYQEITKNGTDWYESLKDKAEKYKQLAESVKDKLDEYESIPEKRWSHRSVKQILKQLIKGLEK